VVILLRLDSENVENTGVVDVDDSESFDDFDETENPEKPSKIRQFLRKMGGGFIGNFSRLAENLGDLWRFRRRSAGSGLTISPSRFSVFVAVNMLVVVAAIAAGIYVQQLAGGYFSQNVLFIAPFTDIADSVTESVDTVVLSAGGRMAVSTAIFTEPSYFSLHFMQFIAGAPWHADDVHTVILNERLAWYLFGAQNVAGLTLQIGGNFYRISGVIRQNATEYMAWLPLAAAANRNLPVNAVYLQMPPNSTVLALNLPLAFFSIVDTTRYIESMGVRHMLLLAIALVLSGFWCGKLFSKAASIVLVAAAVFVVGDILQWLPNLADQRVSVWADLTNIGIIPTDMHLAYGLRRLAWLNDISNYLWLAGAVGVGNLWVGGWVVEV